LVFSSRDAHFRNMPIGATSITIFAGRDRLLLDHSSIEFAGGTVGLWARLTRHLGEPYLLTQVNVSNVELDQVVHALNPEAAPTPGLISGRASAGGDVLHRYRAFGDGVFTLTDSDLVNVPVLRQLYAAMSLQLGGVQRRGEGEARFRLEGGKLELTRLSYSNRGIDVVGHMAMSNIWRGADSPVSGVAHGTVNPLQDIEIPVFRKLARIVTAVQSQSAAVRVSGTLKDRTTQVIPFADIGEGLGRVLGTDSP
jgi:hypothetical protein